VGKWHLDDSDWPVARVVLDGKFEDQEIVEILENVSGIFTRGRSFSFIVDFRGLREPAISHRMLLRNWMKEHEEHTKKNCRGVAYVVSNAAVSILLKAVFKVQRPTAPTRVTSDIRAAEEWVRNQVGWNYPTPH